LSRGLILGVIGILVIAVSLVTVTKLSFSSYHRTLQIDNLKNNNTQNSGFITVTKSETRDHIIKIPYGAGKPDIRSVFFLPARENIHSGNTVEWINEDRVSHTVTSSYFNSGMIWPKGSAYGSSDFKANFKNSGTFAYFCQIHPYMSGVIYVDTVETERLLKDPVTNLVDVKIEMPQNTAFMSNYGPYFIPTYAIAPINSQITWTNKDYIPHTATSTDGSIDTGIIPPGKSKTISVVHNPGTVAYYCRIHPWMQGTVSIP
jgi:plastocyanin